MIDPRSGDRVEAIGDVDRAMPPWVPVRRISTDT